MEFSAGRAPNFACNSPPPTDSRYLRARLVKLNCSILHKERSNNMDSLMDHDELLMLFFPLMFFYLIPNFLLKKHYVYNDRTFCIVPMISNTLYVQHWIDKALERQPDNLRALTVRGRYYIEVCKSV